MKVIVYCDSEYYTFFPTMFLGRELCADAMNLK